MFNSMESIAKIFTRWAGSSLAFLTALLIIGIWLITGPMFDFSTEWSLFINSFTTIITFLMVFLIQRTQNKDSFALHMKLNEIIAAHEGCSNRLINIEDLSEPEIAKLHKRYKKLATKAKEENGWTHQHTIEEIDD